MLKKPSLAEQLPNGLIMANDDYRNRVVVIDPRDDSIVWQYGLTDTSGTAPGMLSYPGRLRPAARQRHHSDAPADGLSMTGTGVPPVLVIRRRLLGAP